MMHEFLESLLYMHPLKNFVQVSDISIIINIIIIIITNILNKLKLLKYVPERSYLLGDSAYPCLKYLIVPYRDNGHLSRAQRNFNQRLSSCRVKIENAFGCLKQRFRQLYHFKLRNIVRMVQVIHACCVLHNLASLDDLELFEPPCHDEYPDPQAEIINVENNFVINDNTCGRDLRDELCRQLI